MKNTQVIKEPLDLYLIKRRIDDGTIGSVSALGRALGVMCGNAMVFNNNDTPEYENAEILSKFCQEKIEEAKEEEEGIGEEEAELKEAKGGGRKGGRSREAEALKTDLNNNMSPLPDAGTGRARRLRAGVAAISAGVPAVQVKKEERQEEGGGGGRGRRGGAGEGGEGLRRRRMEGRKRGRNWRRRIQLWRKEGEGEEGKEEEEDEVEDGRER